MQIKVQIHESVINKVKAQQKAKIRIDAFPDATLEGTIQFVSELAQSSFMDAKNYETVVLIDKIPESMNLKPGMTAKVEILIGTYENVLAVPMNAVTEHLGQSFVYVQDTLGTHRQVVKTGRVTHAFVEIVEGLAENQTILLDAYQRGLADFQQIEDEAANTAVTEKPLPEGGPGPGNPMSGAPMSAGEIEELP
jgi:multidrug efflux pump subunit AcrA (membrane-fusion protein)